jgi:excisionase family DNA binding protein
MIAQLRELEERYLTTGETARCLGVSNPRVLQLAAQGKLVAFKTRLGHFIERESVERLAAQRALRQQQSA